MATREVQARATQVRAPSRRDRVRDAAEQLLRKRGEPAETQALFDLLSADRGLMANMSRHDFNTCLHDDRRARFVRKDGGWALRADG